MDSRIADEGQAIRRRRACTECGRRFTTVENAVLAVVKRNGVTEPFSREKVMKGFVAPVRVGRSTRMRWPNWPSRSRTRCGRRDRRRSPVTRSGWPSLGPLRDLDEVAYLRFASVYRSFESLDDFQREIDQLQANRSLT